MTMTPEEMRLFLKGCIIDCENEADISRFRQIRDYIRTAQETLSAADKMEHWLGKLIIHDKAADYREGLPYNCMELENAAEYLAAYAGKRAAMLAAIEQVNAESEITDSAIAETAAKLT